MDGSLELLDRQVAFLLRQPDDAAFLVQLDPFLRVLRQDPILSGCLDDILETLPRIAAVMEAADAEVVPKLLELRREPSEDDSGAAAPETVRTIERAVYEATLAFFDDLAAGPPRPFNQLAEGGVARTLVNILQGKDKLYTLRLEPRTTVELDPKTGEPIPDGASGDASERLEEADPQRLARWRERLGNVDRQHEHARRWMRLRVRTDAGLALLKLEAARDALNPTVKLVSPEYTVADMVSDTLKWISEIGHLLLLTADGEPLDRNNASQVSEHVAELRADVDRLHEELRRRIGTTRSRQSMVNRFKLRCEWHDRKRMADVASNKSLPYGPEDRLTAELARYLFDQGLSPLAKPITGGLEPDLLDPHARFYVEAKQYKESARDDIVKSFWQIVDTVSKLRGNPLYEVEEAFAVVFRLAGPYYLVPETVEAGDVRVHYVLVDLAEPTDSGRRQRNKPQTITADEFVDAYRSHAAARGTGVEDGSSDSSPVRNADD
jgi:hypothetical protein